MVHSVPVGYKIASVADRTAQVAVVVRTSLDAVGGAAARSCERRTTVRLERQLPAGGLGDGACDPETETAPVFELGDLRLTRDHGPFVVRDSRAVVSDVDPNRAVVGRGAHNYLRTAVLGRVLDQFGERPFDAVVGPDPQSTRDVDGDRRPAVDDDVVGDIGRDIVDVQPRVRRRPTVQRFEHRLGLLRHPADRPGPSMDHVGGLRERPLVEFGRQPLGLADQHRRVVAQVVPEDAAEDGELLALAGQLLRAHPPGVVDADDDVGGRTDREDVPRRQCVRRTHGAEAPAVGTVTEQDAAENDEAEEVPDGDADGVRGREATPIEEEAGRDQADTDDRSQRRQSQPDRRLARGEIRGEVREHQRDAGHTDRGTRAESGEALPTAAPVGRPRREHSGERPVEAS
jgi:hypothetical protein